MQKAVGLVPSGQKSIEVTGYGDLGALAGVSNDHFRDDGLFGK